MKNTWFVMSLPIVGMPWISRPGAFIGSRNRLMPSCLDLSGSVRAPNQYQSAKWADVVQIFWPFIFQPPGTFSARSCMFAASEPGLRLAVADRELDLGGDDLRQELLLQLLAAVADQRLADDADALADLRRGRRASASLRMYS